MHNHTTHRDGDRQPGEGARKPLAIALIITSVFLIVQAIGGVATGSLALLADAGHMATDVAALGLALFAVWLAQRPATPERSFGFARAEVLAALVNSATLVAISFYIFWEAFQRVGDPPEVDSGLMLIVAFAGLGANVASAWVLSRGGGHEHSLNTRGAFLHVMGDMLGSVGAIVAALVMLATGWYLADPILSAGIGLLILWSSWRLMRETAEVLLEATPAHIDSRQVRATMMNIDGVTSVHDLHIWTVTSGLVSMSCHVVVSGDREWPDVLMDLAQVLREQFDIRHVTLQPEDDRIAGEFADCSFDSPGGRAACLSQPSGTQRDPVAHRHQ